MYLVEVEYIWSPSTCARCGNLGHKEKRCLLPLSSSTLVKTTFLGVIGEILNVPVVNIENILQVSNLSFPKTTSTQEKSAPFSDSHLHIHVEIQYDQKEMEPTTKEVEIDCISLRSQCTLYNV